MAVTAIHPGQHLAEELSELGMSAAEFAQQLDVPTNRITEILNDGPSPVTRPYALHIFWHKCRVLAEPAELI